MLKKPMARWDRMSFPYTLNRSRHGTKVTIVWSPACWTLTGHLPSMPVHWTFIQAAIIFFPPKKYWKNYLDVYKSNFYESLLSANKSRLEKFLQWGLVLKERWSSIGGGAAGLCSAPPSLQGFRNLHLLFQLKCQDRIPAPDSWW